jgi:hypothetical protein
MVPDCPSSSSGSSAISHGKFPAGPTPKIAFFFGTLQSVINCDRVKSQTNGEFLASDRKQAAPSQLLGWFLPEAKTQPESSAPIG